jgi:hypothetical protein
MLEKYKSLRERGGRRMLEKYKSLGVLMLKYFAVPN